MAIRVAINGFGRIGRNILRASLDNKKLDFVAVNDLTTPETLAHLLKYDSILGTLETKVKAKKNAIVVGDREIRILSVRDPAALPWKELKIDVVVESTGLFLDRAGASKHLAAGARKVIITAPAKEPDVTMVLGVNDGMYNPKEHHIISNASCTTNCLAPVAKVLLDNFGIVKGLMTTVHAYTNDQRILDFPHKDLRRARAAAVSIIPTTTGAARAVSLVLPQLKGKLDGMAMRVPTPNVSVVDLVALTEKETTKEQVNEAMKAASRGALKGILQYVDEPLVSKDFNGSPFSSSFDSALTSVIGGNLVKVISWYDNEWGYSCRVRDLILFISKKR
ncbi:MAG: type I glyceraldehyde-3-phosphate dehydrogenase [bacterium]